MQHQSKHVEDPSQGQTNLEVDPRRRNFYLRSQPLCGLQGKEKRKEGERTTPSSQTPNWNYLPSLRGGGQQDWPHQSSSYPPNRTRPPSSTLRGLANTLLLLLLFKVSYRARNPPYALRPYTDTKVTIKYYTKSFKSWPVGKYLKSRICERSVV